MLTLALKMEAVHAQVAMTQEENQHKKSASTMNHQEILSQ
jgi:hypothetical protein